MTDPDFTQRTLSSPSGAQLAVYDRTATGDARGIIHINHGLAEHGARYAPFAAYLSSRGYHVAAHDHRGHGATTSDDGAPRRFADKDGWNKLMEDVQAVNTDLQAKWPGLPVIVFGHSMGGVVSFNHVLRQADSVAGAAVWNANTAMGGNIGLIRMILFFEALVGGPYTPSLTLENMTFKAWNKRFPERRTDADWLSRDLEEVDKYHDDPVCGWPSSVSLWRDFLLGVEFAADDANLEPVRKDMPFHLIGGSKDPATEGGKAIRILNKRLKKAGFTDVQCEVLKGFRHETLNEIGRDEQMKAFADWADRVTG
jgi:alpha-beta hydrolase superfamily lysophospholipase